MEGEFTALGAPYAIWLLHEVFVNQTPTLNWLPIHCQLLGWPL